MTQKTREIAEEAHKSGISPLEVMLHAMRLSFAEGDLDKAVGYACHAAPYMHPRLSSVKQEDSIKQDQLVQAMIDGRRRINEHLEREELRRKARAIAVAAGLTAPLPEA